MFALPESFDLMVRVAVLPVVALAAIALMVRAVGLRTLSKMTAIDFVVTLATGSLLASAATATGWTAYLQALGAIVALNLAQFGYARARQRSDRFRQATENAPLLLMRDGEMFDAALAAGRIARADIMAKLREAGIAAPEQVALMVLEPTGDISITPHGDHAPGAAVLHGVRDVG
ncbi:DUF421 domain-containing protein [Sphingomonas baiyangensis]|uniref:DUF421 domain-containing protein n=1 Tax=Sphingomonas baiyangensis TaxID=2572576 RepID=A0A4U1L997_9SPHN|nr:YetF domain-containing protein [Sphingomonas baiyangensis]TKD52995.1 DUF421 domain-containing protein [Sphingomonas baiyangensis]